MTYLRHLETAVPPTAYSQEFVEARMEKWAKTERQVRYLRQIYRHSSIDKRHSVVSDFMTPEPSELYRITADGRINNPDSSERNAMFVKHARPMAVELARRTVANCPGLAAADVTHVITVSCTGFFNPGMDYYVVRDAGLSPTVQRYQLGFMGCYAAIPALRMARQFCEADPQAVVLVLCLELCTLHLHPYGSMDDMLANSLFADGASCAVVSGRPPPEGAAAYRFGEFASSIIPQGEKDMAWTVGDHGFDIVLSSYVPKILGAGIRDVMAPLLGGQGLQESDIVWWAVHPGGRAILDKVESGLGLRPEQVAVSREVLRRFGNMSSATVLFVLKDLLATPAAKTGDRVCAMAFGPGLTVESVVLELQGVKVAEGSGEKGPGVGGQLSVAPLARGGPVAVKQNAFMGSD